MLKYMKEVEIMENYYYYAIGALVFIIVLVISILLFQRKKRPQKSTYDVDAIAEIFDKNNVLAFDYIRNKMVITFQDVSLFNVEELQLLGAKNVSIVGDKVKFLLEEDREKNETIYAALKDSIGR